MNRAPYISEDYTMQQEKFFSCATTMILSGVVYRLVVSHAQSQWTMLTLGFVLMCVFFLILLGYQLCREIRLAYITAFYNLGMAFGVAFFTTWADRYLISMGFVFLQLGVFKFLASIILHQIPFRVPTVTLSNG